MVKSDHFIRYSNRWNEKASRAPSLHIYNSIPRKKIHNLPCLFIHIGARRKDENCQTFRCPKFVHKTSRRGWKLPFMGGILHFGAIPSLQIGLYFCRVETSQRELGKCKKGISFPYVLFPWIYLLYLLIIFYICYIPTLTYPHPHPYPYPYPTPTPTPTPSRYLWRILAYFLRVG